VPSFIQRALQSPVQLIAKSRVSPLNTTQSQLSHDDEDEDEEEGGSSHAGRRGGDGGGDGGGGGDGALPFPGHPLPPDGALSFLRGFPVRLVMMLDGFGGEGSDFDIASAALVRRRRERLEEAAEAAKKELMEAWSRGMVTVDPAAVQRSVLKNKGRLRGVSAGSSECGETCPAGSDSQESSGTERKQRRKFHSQTARTAGRPQFGRCPPLAEPPARRTTCAPRAACSQSTTRPLAPRDSSGSAPSAVAAFRSTGTPSCATRFTVQTFQYCLLNCPRTWKLKPVSPRAWTL